MTTNFLKVSGIMKIRGTLFLFFVSISSEPAPFIPCKSKSGAKFIRDICVAGSDLANRISSRDVQVSNQNLTCHLLLRDPITFTRHHTVKLYFEMAAAAWVRNSERNMTADRV